MTVSRPRKSDALKGFLRELSELTKRYGFVVDGPDYGGGPVLIGNGENVDIYYDHNEERYGVL
jgi:hypothetical protein